MKKKKMMMMTSVCVSFICSMYFVFLLVCAKLAEINVTMLNDLH